jgi:hypothetical protein
VSVTLFALLFPSFAQGQYLPVPGPGPIAPAPELSAYSAPSDETLDPPPPRGYAEDIRKAKQEAASAIGTVPGTVQHDLRTSAETSWNRSLVQSSVEQESGPTPNAPALSTNFNGIDYTGSFPPDPVLAAGPSNLVLSTNGSVTIRDKTGSVVASTSLSAFFSSVRALSENTFDPKVVFDTGSNRFFLAAVGMIDNPSCTAGTCVSHFFLAVSKTANPTTTGSGDWYFYAFDATLDGPTPTTNWADFPGLGVDNNVVVLTANMFTFKDESFQSAKIRILDKSVLIAGGSVTWTDFFAMRDPGTGFTSFTLQPALTFGSPGTFFLVSASQTSGSCNLVVWGIQSPLSSPTLSARTATAGGTCDFPPNAKQLGGGTPLDTGDTRLLNAVYRNGSLWTAHSIQTNFGSVNVSAIRWVQINLGNWPNSVSLTQDNTFGADNFWYFYPAIMVDASNTLAIAFARSGASEFASARYTGRLGTDAANTLEPSALLKAGTANYLRLDSGGTNRWGDYYGIGLDPSDGSFWFLGEYAAAPSEWGTWVARLEFPSPAAFVTRLYQTVLLREPDADGLAAHIQNIQQFGTVIQTVLALFKSQEFLSQSLSDTQFLDRLYHTFLNRDPDQAGLNAFLNDLTSGLRTRDNLIDIFLDSAEFRTQASFLPPQEAVTAFVISLYVRILGRGPDQAGLQGFVAQLQATRTVLPTVQGFLASPEFLARNTSNTEFVTLLYRVFLNRVPDAGGLMGWVLALSGGMTRDQLVAQFAASPEFQAIQHQLFPLEQGLSLRQAQCAA